MDIGTWVKAGTFVGRVARIEEDGTTVLFNPGDRQMLRATPGTLQHLPTGSVDVTVTTRVDVPHGLTEDSLRRWIAAQLDPVLAQRATESLSESGLDPAVFGLVVDVAVREVGD